MKSSKLKIALDSSVFRDFDFIEYLQNNSDQYTISLSVIVYFETYHWYNIRGISKELFDKEINALSVRVTNLTPVQIDEISDNVRTSKLRFKHHTRDIIIGTHSSMEDSLFITTNVKHFQWMMTKPSTPDEFIKKYVQI